MSRIIVEGELELEIGDEWDVALKWDDCSAYRRGIQTLDSCKAVDVLVFSRARGELMMIELKDFRSHRIENKDRIRDGALFVEVGHKVRDTIAGVCGAARKGDDAELLEISALLGARTPLTVVLWLEEDAHRFRGPSLRSRVDSDAMTRSLKSRLRWLTPYVLVCSRRGPTLENRGIVVRSRPFSS